MKLTHLLTIVLWSSSVLAAPAHVIVDQRGVTVGPILQMNAVLFSPDGQAELAVLLWNGTWAQTLTTSIDFYHTTPDCTGPRYLDARTLPIAAPVVGPYLLWPANVTTVNVQAVEYFTPTMSLGQQGLCYSLVSPELAGVAQVTDLRSFGFVTPFVVR